MKKKSILPVLTALFILVSISAKAQSSGAYAIVEGMFKYNSTSTRDGQNNIVSQDASTMGASIGVGYLASPNNDGQGVSIGVELEIATLNNSYTNITGMPDTKEKMIGAALVLGYHLVVIPRLYYVPQLSVGLPNSEPSQYVEAYQKWYTGTTVHSVGIELNLLNFEFKSNDTPFSVRFGMGGITYLNSTADNVPNSMHTFDFDLNTFTTAVIYYF